MGMTIYRWPDGLTVRPVSKFKWSRRRAVCATVYFFFFPLFSNHLQDDDEAMKRERERDEGGWDAIAFFQQLLHVHLAPTYKKLIIYIIDLKAKRSVLRFGFINERGTKSSNA
jgi:hypothetical protein